MATVKYCPKCGFEETDFPYDGCPICNSLLSIRQADKAGQQPIETDVDKRQSSDVSIGDGAAVGGNVTSNNTTYDTSSTSIINNVTIKEKSEAEKYEDSVRVFRHRCRDLCRDGFLSKDDEVVLEKLRIDIGLSADKSFELISEEKKLSKKVIRVLPPEINARLSQTRSYIEQNNTDKLRTSIEILQGWKKNYDVDELNQLYYQLLAIFSPKQLVDAPEDTYWMYFWGSVAYLTLDRITESETLHGFLSSWDTLFPEQNVRILATIKALIGGEAELARTCFSAVHAGYSKDLEQVVQAIKSLLEMDWESETAMLPPTGRFYYKNLFKSYCDFCQNQAEKVRQERASVQRKKQEEDECKQREWIQRQQDIANTQAEAKLVEEERRLEEERRKKAEAEAEAARKKAEADKAEKERLIEQQKAEKAERRRKCRLWWKQNLKWFLWVIAAILMYVVISSMYQSCQNQRQRDEAIAEQQRQDSLAFIEKQRKFNELCAEFEDIMMRPMTKQILSRGRQILIQLNNMESDCPELSSFPMSQNSRQYNDSVDAVVIRYNDMIDNPHFDQKQQDVWSRERDSIKLMKI